MCGFPILNKMVATTAGASPKWNKQQVQWNTAVSTRIRMRNQVIEEATTRGMTKGLNKLKATLLESRETLTINRLYGVDLELTDNDGSKIMTLYSVDLSGNLRVVFSDTGARNFIHENNAPFCRDLVFIRLLMVDEVKTLKGRIRVAFET